ncbi:MAG TPA: hypothetical protein G4O11_13555 [Anaerolineae bacterium]|nr:hypothetical protein [Anaerolineae bacterium]
MPSTTVIVTSVTSFLGFLLNTGVMYLVLSKGRKRHHYLFAGILLICAIWDFGVFLAMIRNRFVEELVIYGYIVFYPCIFLPALIFHFTGSYLNQVRVKTTILLYVVCAASAILMAFGITGRLEGIYTYSWGQIFRPDEQMLAGFPIMIAFFIIPVLASCWFFYQAYRKETSPLPRRHLLYIFTGFMMISFATVKTLVLLDIDVPVLLPAGMFFNDIFAAVIGIAIIKDRLFDITLIIQKGAIYSGLAAVLIFVFSFSEHMLVTYLGHFFGEHSQVIHLLSIALVIAILMPVKHRLERGIEGFFAKRQLEF